MLTQMTFGCGQCVGRVHLHKSGKECKYPVLSTRESVESEGLPRVACAKRTNAASDGTVPSDAAFVRCACYPRQPFTLNALTRTLHWILAFFPRLAARLMQMHPPYTLDTAKGHLGQHRQGLDSIGEHPTSPLPSLQRVISPVLEPVAIPEVGQR